MRLLILIFSLTGCVSLSLDEEAHRLSLWNFKYKADVDDEWLIYDRIDQPFFGDCEDLSLSLQKQIGGDVWYVLLLDGTAHAALVKNKMVYDSLFKHPVELNEYKGTFLYMMN